MFGLFSSQNKKMRDTARNWLEMAERVWNYRRDVLSSIDLKDLSEQTEALRKKIKAGADAAELKLSIESLEPVLKRTGGKIYPKTSMIDNVEFFLVAALVVLGIRAYILQPFKIPTNSMWPTYHGMTAENLLVEKENPSLVARALRLVAFGAFRYEALAPQSGEVSAKYFRYNNGAVQLAYTVKNGRKWLVIPAQFKQYTFYVNGAETSFAVPFDFNDVDNLVIETFFGTQENFIKAAGAALSSGNFETSSVLANDRSSEVYPTVLLKLGKQVQVNEPVMRFDILTGDQLFVDRMSYHFVRPSVGDGFVFRTGNIPGIGADQFYIKRLVGVPGDKLEIREPVLYRNGAPITGAGSFDFNAKRVAPYKGYADATSTHMSFLKKGEVLEIPKDKFFAMGDNSYNSRDSRDWGFVPAQDALGRPLFIYYPLTKRWGIAK